ncbi:MAG: DUF4157 domain-containing protein [Kaiparowitsia implicata GSE-PSE-MK54-09C]|jgi:hypothetical protein|nr:DUF4157 domain-containing protein [Kaiparowitsia implicata GSE-PSE-MK54-09C]
MPTHLQAKHTPAPTAAPAASQFSARGFEEETEQVEEQVPEVKELAGGADAPPSEPSSPPPADGGSAPPSGDGANPNSNFSFLDMPLNAEEAGVQAKLTIGEPGDKYEREADQTAAQVMRMPDPQGSDPLETEAGAPEIQQRGKGFGPASTAQLQRRLNQQAGKGTSLPKSVQSFMAPRFGQDFGQVRVHTDSSAVQMNKELGAQAFTHGNDIYFNQGKYSPGSSGGRELLAHELTHTIQQTGGIRAKSLAKGNKIQAKLDISAAMPGVQMREGAAPAPTPAPAEPQSVKPEPDKGEEAPEAKTRPASMSPEQDPGFVAVTTRAKGTAEDKKTHKPASTESHDAQEAAVSPANEVESIAQDQYMGEMQQEEPGSFDAASFVEDVLAKVEGLIPDTEEKAENFPEDNELNTVRDDLSSDVEEEQKEAAGPIEEANAEDPDTSSVDARESDPMEDMPPGTAPGDLGAKEAAPKSKPDSEISDPIEEEAQSLDQQMEEADVTEEQLANSNEPEFTAALDEKQKAKTNAEQAPGEYREGEAATLNQAEAEACGIATSQTQGMQDSRVGTVSELTGLKGDAKGQDEGKRQEIADHIDGIYERVKGEVETALNDLDTRVMNDFDNATEEAKRLFEDYVDREIKAYKQNRYWDETYEQSRSGIENVTDRLLGSAGDHWLVEGGENLAAGVGAYYWGSGRAVSDLITGMPPEFNQIFADGKTVYMNHMSTALTGIANLVTDTLNDAKQKIANGKQEISAYVASLPSDLQDIGQEAADNIQSKFNDLEQQVNDKRDELVTKLADKYAENLEELDERIEQLEAENSGLINRALNAMSGVIQQILEIKALLEQVFAGAQGVIDSIIQDPIGFLNNLITGLTQGFNNFLGNIVTHLQSGLIGWLTGTLGSVGLEMPEDIFSLKGIFSLTTQVLGLTWDYVRSKAVRMFGEPAVSGMEQGSELFMMLKNDGPSGMWNEVQDQFTDLKQTVMDEIQNMLITEVFRAGVKWVLGLLTPATAFIKAGMMIFDIIMFFIENAQQIMALVESIIASVSAVAGGDTNQMAVAVENSLATALPVAIGFLAALLGLGGLTKRVQKLFEAIRERIDAAIEWVLRKAKKLFKGNKKKEEDNKTTDQDREKHKVIAEDIKEKLKENSEREINSQEDFYQEKTRLGRELEKQNQPKLKNGIKLNIAFDKPKKEDSNLDVEIKIAPNDEVERFKLPIAIESILGKRIGSGADKDVYESKGNAEEVVAVPKNETAVPKVREEIEYISVLQGRGIPVISVIRTVEADGITAYVMKRYEGNIKPIAFGAESDHLLNKSSIDSLIEIREIIEEKQVHIRDLQFLIDSQGKLVVADPLGVGQGEGYLRNLDHIDVILVTAIENVTLEILESYPQGLTQKEIYDNINNSKLDNEMVSRAIFGLSSSRFGEKIVKIDEKWILNKEQE